jgi:hypothetical protein
VKERRPRDAKEDHPNRNKQSTDGRSSAVIYAVGEDGTIWSLPADSPHSWTQPPDLPEADEKEMARAGLARATRIV